MFAADLEAILRSSLQRHLTGVIRIDSQKRFRLVINESPAYDCPNIRVNRNSKDLFQMIARANEGLVSEVAKEQQPLLADPAERAELLIEFFHLPVVDAYQPTSYSFDFASKGLVAPFYARIGSITERSYDEAATLRKAIQRHLAYAESKKST